MVMKGASLIVILETLLLASCFTHLKGKVQELGAISLEYQGYLEMPVLLANPQSLEWSLVNFQSPKGPSGDGYHL